MVTPTPLYQEVLEIGLILFAFIAIAIYRTQVWKAIKEIFLDLLLALIFVGAVITIFNITNSTTQAIIFDIGILGIIGARTIYFLLKGTPLGRPPIPH
jgi:hypothetical protein